MRHWGASNMYIAPHIRSSVRSGYHIICLPYPRVYFNWPLVAQCSYLDCTVSPDVVGIVDVTDYEIFPSLMYICLG